MTATRQEPLDKITHILPEVCGAQPPRWPHTPGVIPVISGRVALRAFDRGRGARCATGRNSRDNFADDRAVTLSSRRALGPLIWSGVWGSIAVICRVIGRRYECRQPSPAKPS